MTASSGGTDTKTYRPCPARRGRPFLGGVSVSVTASHDDQEPRSYMPVVWAWRLIPHPAPPITASSAIGCGGYRSTNDGILGLKSAGNSRPLPTNLRI